MSSAEPRLGDFATQARIYGARPSYPAAMLDLLIEHVGVQAGDAVAEVGASTGIFTRLLAERGLSVTAIEPSRAMRATAPDLDAVTWIPGSGERTGLESASQRWLVAAQSFHWVDTESGLAEARRVLVRGGPRPRSRSGHRVPRGRGTPSPIRASGRLTHGGWYLRKAQPL